MPKEEEKDSNILQQAMLLNAMKYTSDPNKMKQMAGMQKVADVFSTFDKIAMHKEYRKALHMAGVDMDFIIQHLKDVIISVAPEKNNKLAAIKLLMTSLGIDKAAGAGDVGANTWEEELLRIEDKYKDKEESPFDKKQDYVVEAPKVPEEVKERRKQDNDIERSLYE